jgi:hypothetical protein
MLKAITHFEQVPLGLVMKIVERERQKETREDFHGKNKQDLPGVPAPVAIEEGTEND